MGEGFLCVKTHLGQVSELNRLARQWGAKFVNTVTNVRQTNSHFRYSTVLFPEGVDIGISAVCY